MIFISHQLPAAIVINGDTSGLTSFTFPVSAHARSQGGEAFYVGALNASTGATYAVSGNFMEQPSFEPFALQSATINGIADQANPLYNAAIAQLGTFETSVGLGRTAFLPMIVPQANPADLFLVRELRGNTLTMLGLSNVQDATGATSQGILGLQAFVTEAIFAAVLPSSSAQFGDPGSGVALIGFGEIRVDDVMQKILMQVNADPNSVLPSTTPVASPLDVTSTSLKINDNLVSIQNALDMHYSRRLQRLYVAMSVQGGAGATDGARAIAVGSVNNNKVSFNQIAPDSVFTDADEIVGGVGANTQVSISHVRTMYTSTRLDYLIVVGGNGAPGTTNNQVYALPLVDTLATGTVNEAIQGTLANVNVPPVDIFSPGTDACANAPQMLKARVFPQAATAPGDMYTSASIQAQVGGGALPYGAITDTNVIYDTVFVSVATPAAGQLPGIFYSQALFDDTGMIAAWTPWQRVAGTTDPVYAFSYEPTFADFVWLTGTSATTIVTAKRTAWGTGSSDGLADLVTVVSQLMPQASGGVQGLFNLPSNTAGLFDISMFIATGLNQVVLIESGQVVAGAVVPDVGDFQTDMQQFTDGQITTNFPVGTVRVVSISGGALSSLGAIIAAALGVNSTTQQGYLFVGGAGGLSVLAQADGSGWSTLTGLGYNFTGLANGMRFMTVGNYSFVRSLVYDDGFLYVLTDTQLDRIDIAASDFATGTLSVTTVATLAQVKASANGTMLSLLVSGKYAMIGASTGLWRVGDGSNIQTAVNAAEVNWTQVAIPEGISAVQYMQAISNSAAQNSFAQGIGNVYINDAYRGYDQAHVNRYTVANVSAAITQSTIVPLPDMIVKDILTAFRVFNGFRNIINFDGAALFSTRDRVLVDPPLMFNWLAALPLNTICDSYISSIVLSSASGAWLVAGDFGLRVNE